MAIVYLSLGSNLGNRENHLALAREALQKTFDPARFSKIYETEPVDFLDQPWFLNQVAEVQTDLSPDSLLEWIRALENRMGRQREIPKGPRTLDVDILLYDDWIWEGEDLTLPHPRLVFRRHVLVPLAELAPAKVIPGCQLPVLELLRQVKDFSVVKPYAST